MGEQEFLNELTRRYPEMVLIPAQKSTDILNWARDAYHVICRAADIMEIEQISQWEGARAVLESCPLSSEYLAKDTQ